MTEQLPYAAEPKHVDDFHVCNCASNLVKPAKGEIQYKVEGGGTIEKMRYWCMRCGLTLRQTFIDMMGEAWKDTRNKPLVHKSERGPDAPYDPLA
jgi:hypothetical protein